ATKTVSTFGSKEKSSNGVLEMNQQVATVLAERPAPSSRAQLYAAAPARGKNGAWPTLARVSPPQVAISQVNQRAPFAGKYVAAFSPNGAATRISRPAFHHRAAKYRW